MFMTKKKKMQLAYAALCDYIDDAARRFNRAFLYEHQRSLLVLHSTALIIHYACIRFNVEDTVLQVYLLNSNESDSYKKELAYAYFELKQSFKDTRSLEYYDSMCLLDSMYRMASNPMNRIYDVKYGQLIFTLKQFLNGLEMKWSSPSNGIPTNEAIYRFFVNEEPTIDSYIHDVLAAIN